LHGAYRAIGWMSLQIELQQFEQCFCVVSRYWQANGTFKAHQFDLHRRLPHLAVRMDLQSKFQIQFLGGERTCPQPVKYMVQHPVENKKKRIDQINWIFKLNLFLKLQS